MAGYVCPSSCSRPGYMVIETVLDELGPGTGLILYLRVFLIFIKVDLFLHLAMCFFIDTKNRVLFSENYINKLFLMQFVSVTFKLYFLGIHIILFTRVHNIHNYNFLAIATFLLLSRVYRVKSVLKYRCFL